MNREPICGSSYRQTIIRNTSTSQPVIAIDFDGTIAKGYFEVNDWYINHNVPARSLANEDVVPVLRTLHRMGFRIILWTCRTGQDLEIAKSFLDALGIIDLFLAFNENVPDLPFPTSRKICADFYVDDSNYNVSARELIMVEVFWNIVKRSKPTEMYVAQTILASEAKAYREDKGNDKKMRGVGGGKAKRNRQEDEVQRNKSGSKKGRHGRATNNRTIQTKESGED